jgi:hypothetical protein
MFKQQLFFDCDFIEGTCLKGDYFSQIDAYESIIMKEEAQ